MNDLFRKFSSATSNAVGSSWEFIVAIAIVLIWGLTGPIFGFSDTWQLVINTGTTIVTFLMVVLIQNMQNRDAKAVISSWTNCFAASWAHVRGSSIWKT